MSDNGGLAAHTGWRDGEIHTQNAPLSSGKGSLMEGGIREPMIVRWPGHTAPGSQCDSYLIIEDFYPTITEMASIDPAASDHYGHAIDGISFVPMIDGTADTSTDRTLIWNYPHVWGLSGPGIDLSCSIRKNQWKLIYNYADHSKMLFDIDNDISEKNNLASEHPDIVKALSSELGERLRAVDAKRPTVKATGEPCPWPDEIGF